MDSNGLRFWMLAGRADWILPKELEYDDECGVVRLSNIDNTRQWPGTKAESDAMLKLVPRTIDLHDRVAFADVKPGGSTVKGGPIGGDPAAAATIFESPQEITDIAASLEGVLYIATTTSVWLRDMHYEGLERWKPVELTNPGVKPWRLAVDPDGGCWVLTVDGKLARVTGSPLPSLVDERYATSIVRPQQENTSPPALTLWFPNAVIGAGENPAAICAAAGRLAILAITNAKAKLYQPLAGMSEALTGMRFPVSAKWLADGRIALLYPGATEAAIYEPGRGFSSDFYPLNGPENPLGEPFVQTPQGEARFLQAGKPKRLDKLSLAKLARQGTARAAHALDSGTGDTVWHRVYLEARLPAHTFIQLDVAASQSADPASVVEWHAHWFGRNVSGQPSAVWLTEASEIPFHPGLLKAAPERDHAGLFSVLLQRTGHRVSSIKGRYLHVRAGIRGTEQWSPAIAALRAYGSRFSYADRYLPELYRETEFGPDADAQSDRTTAPDFLNRFLGLFESVLTPIEDRVAAAHLLTYPASTRDRDLDWLGQWVGVTFDPAFPADRRRDWLQNSGELRRWRGTLYGLQLALDIATGGGVSGGEIVVIENYRLRRVLATILGVDLTAYTDPLLPGADYGGNSIVGDTFVLGDDIERQVLALYNVSLNTTADGRSVREQLFDDLASRVTVLVHQEFTPQDLGLIRRVAEREKPADVQLTIAPAAFPFLAGIASLLGVDTYLARKRKPGPVVVGSSRIGVADLVTQPATLDPHFKG